MGERNAVVFFVPLEEWEINNPTEMEFVERVKYYGNWDVLRPAKIVEGLEPISENLLDKLNEEAQNMIEKMRCAV